MKHVSLVTKIIYVYAQYHIFLSYTQDIYYHSL